MFLGRKLQSKMSELFPLGVNLFEKGSKYFQIRVLSLVGVSIHLNKMQMGK